MGNKPLIPLSTNEPRPVIERIPIASLKPWPSRARTHDRGKRQALLASIRANGLIDPIIVDENAFILSGHLRSELTAELGWEYIEAIVIQHLSLEDKRAYVIAANRFPERGGWDREILALEFTDLVDTEIDLDLRTTGFEIAEIDLAIRQTEHQPANDDDVELEVPQELISRLGDHWLLGDHELICGNSLEPDVWCRLMRDDKARLCLTDPPYNRRIKGDVSSKGHTEFQYGSGEMSDRQFQTFLSDSLSLAVSHSVDGALHLIAMDHYHLDDLFAAANPLYSKRLNIITWAKTTPGMGSLYRSQHEFFALYKVGHAPHVNNVQLGRFGRNRSNVWTYAGAAGFRKGRDEDLADHPTVKPTDLLADAILDLTDPCDTVIDGFGGSGSLILAAERTRRRARVIELEPKYVDVAIRRWEAMTGQQARLAGSGATFSDAGQRGAVLALPAPAKRED
nr:DNA methyltransferase [uncultured Hyphomonas sp.]